MRNQMDQELIHNGRDRINKGRRFTAAAAALVFGAMSLLTACGGSPAQGVNTGQGGQGVTEDETAGGQSAKGRFMEEEITIPEEVADNGFAAVLQNDDKSLLFCIPDEDGRPRLYTYDTKSRWTRGDVIPGPEGVRLKNMMKDGNGRIYYGGFGGEEYVYHLWTIGEDGTVQELLQDAFQIPEGKSYGIIPDFVGVMPGGEFLVSQSSEAGLFLPDGKKSITMPQDFIGMDVRLPACISGEDYLTLSDQKLVCYNIRTGGLAESYSLPDNLTGSNDQYSGSLGQMPVFTDDDDIYLADQTGLYRIVKGGTLWEQLIDGSLNSMGRQDIYMMAFFKGADNDYYGVFSTSDSKMKLFRYYFDETVDTVPPETLTVYSLRDITTVRQAAALLQKNNPQVKVDYRVAVADPYEKVTEDVIRALNTELLNGKGADILILDGLPMETYKNKGILADISNLFESQREELLPNIVGNFTADDGKIYYMPARIKVPVIYGDQAAVAAFQNLGKMASYDKTPTLFAPDIYENILNMTAHTCYSELFNKEGTVNQEDLTRWLTAVKSAGDKGNVQISFDQADMERYHVNNIVIPNGFGRQSDYNLVTGNCAAAVEMLDSIDSAMLPVSAAQLNGSRLEAISGIYLPSVVAAINESCENKENAEDFIRTLFGAQVQDESLRDGFAVRSSSLDKWAGMEKEIRVSMSMGNETVSLSGKWPEQADRDSILAIVRTASVPALIDMQIMEMIVDGSKGYLEGKETVEDAVRNIENKMKLYVNERE